MGGKPIVFRLRKTELRQPRSKGIVLALLVAMTFKYGAIVRFANFFKKAVSNLDDTT